MTNKEQYKCIFKRVFDVDEKDLDENFNFKNIEKWDSITHLTLISELEDAFSVMFETEDILHFGGFVNGMSILTGYGVDFDN